MELIRRNSDYALRSLIYMARLPLGRKFTIKAIAKEQNVPTAFLKKTFQKLSVRKVVGSQRGPNGGFYLLKQPSLISLREILESVQGRITLSECLFEHDTICNYAANCKIKQKLKDIQKKLTGLLNRTRLEDFIY